MAKYNQGVYQIQNPDKYVGKGQPKFRSSWERVFFQFCDLNPAVLKWASEAITVPYRNPFTGKNTIYVPDIFMMYVDKSGQTHAELIEIKPSNEVTMENARSAKDQAYVILNHAKWSAAYAYCKSNGLKFRIVSESDIFHMGGKKVK
jgi:hypothetical protein